MRSYDATRWPADKVERRPIESLIPYARNSRTHSDAQVAQIAASMKEWGWTNPVLIDEEGGIIAGHGRVLAARKLGIAEVPVMVAEGWTEAQRRAYVIADNKLAMNAGWDEELLRIELTHLGDVQYELGLTGFDLAELDDVMVDIQPLEGDDLIGRANEHGRLEKYLDQDVKMIRLTYHADDYDHVYDAIESYMKAHNLDDISTAVMSRFMQG